MKYDIAIIGAGASGIAAAVAAAESGLKTVLVERYGFIGGLASSAMVGTVCGLYFRNEYESRFAVQGFARRFAQQLMRLDGFATERFDRGLHFLPYRIGSFHRSGYYELKKAGVDIILHTRVSSVQIQKDRIVSLGLQFGAETNWLGCNAMVDCSGESLVPLLAGLPVLVETKYQSGALVFQVAGLPALEPGQLALHLIRCVKRGIQRHHLDEHCDRLSIVPGSLEKGIALFKLGLKQPFNPEKEALTSYELEARSRCFDIVKYLSKDEKDFKSLAIINMPTQIGIRSGPRPVGLQQLEENSVLQALKPADGVAIGAWPVELWGEERKPAMKYFHFDDYYLIPAGALVSAHIENLFFAGRGFSASELAMASARVIGTCLGSGYAAGKLAATYVQTADWNVAIPSIQQAQVWSGFAAKW